MKLLKQAQAQEDGSNLLSSTRGQVRPASRKMRMRWMRVLYGTGNIPLPVTVILHANPVSGVDLDLATARKKQPATVFTDTTKAEDGAATQGVLYQIGSDEENEEEDEDEDEDDDDEEEQRQSSRASHTPDEWMGGCYLLSLLLALLGRLWPMERVVVGLRVCRQLRRELSEHGGSVLLVQRVNSNVNCQALNRDFLCVSHSKVYLKWRGQSAGLKCAASLGTALIHLDLSWNGIGPEGAKELAGMLGECKALVHLDLFGNGIGDAVVAQLAGVLGDCKALAYLDLGDNGIGNEGISQLVGVLGECKALAYLGLSYNGICGEILKILGGGLGECKALVHLNLHGNGMFDKEAGELAKVLGECRALVHLDLSRNWIGDEGAEALAGSYAALELAPVSRFELVP